MTTALDAAEQDRRLKGLTKDLRTRGIEMRRRFFCPILMVDEPAELCRGHVLPRAVGGNTWVVQRKDVDSFYGSFADADFGHGLKLRTSDPDQMLRHVRKHKLWKRITVEDPHVPPARPRIDARMQGVANGNYHVRLRFDVGYQTLLSCIHTVHLGRFRELGYRYVGESGWFLAALLREIYMRYFGSGSKLDRNRVKRDSSELAQMCLPYRNLVRPLLTSDGLYHKLLDDPFRWFAVAWDGDAIFAVIDFLKAGDEVNAIMSPVTFDERSAAIVCSSMPISFDVGLARFGGDAVHEVSAHRTRVTWTCGDQTARKRGVPIGQAASEMARRMRSW